jgi:hypothetical protein
VLGGPGRLGGFVRALPKEIRPSVGPEQNDGVRHARPEDLTPLEPLLERLRAVPALSERKPGTFYRGSRAFLHFHVDPAGLFADVRAGTEWQRLSVDTADQQQVLAALVAAATG